MKAFAAILCMYWIALLVQPVFSPIQPKKEKVMSCCVKKHEKNKMHNSCGKESKDNCCGNGVCNPLFSQCPVCSPACVPQNKMVFSLQPADLIQKEKFPVYEQHFSSWHLEQLLRPPQVV